MNRNIVCTRSVLRFFRSTSANYKHITHRNLTQFKKPCKSNGKLNVITSPMCRTPKRPSSSNSDLKSTEPNQNVLDDAEFQNILRDFSKDFGLGSDSENLLNDIKQTIDKSNDGNVDMSSVTDENPNSSKDEANPKGALLDTFKHFSDSDSIVIQSYEDIVSGAHEENELNYNIDQSSCVSSLPQCAKRGISGVFDVAELVEVLRNENLLDITVISIPKELHYADFLVLVTAKSPRHSSAVAEYVNKLYKMKKHTKDPFIIVEGEKVSNWKALDMGNIVLHIFLEETRAFYDIESLWLFDSEFDSGGTLQPDPVFDALQEQMSFFDSLRNSTSNETTNECIKETT